jgi:hypothetical protein
MTYDGTEVDPEELRKFSKGAGDRAKNAADAADAVGSVHMGHGMLGIFSQMFLDSANDDQQQVLTTMRATVNALYEDSGIAATNASTFTDTNQSQASRFTNKELP